MRSYELRTSKDEPPRLKLMMPARYYAREQARGEGKRTGNILACAPTTLSRRSRKRRSDETAGFAISQAERNDDYSVLDVEYSFVRIYHS